MQLVAADLLADACGLSPALAFVTLLAGLLLWLFGWRSHRFWIVLAATVLAGVFGLAQAPGLHAPPLPTAVLLALAAGLLALSLVRVFVFAAAGLTVVLLTQELWPTLNQPVLVFLLSGLFCHFLFRLCLTALTSLAGALLLHYGVLMLLHLYAGLDAAAAADRVPGVLNGTCAVVALIGFVVQTYFHRRARRAAQGDDEQRAWVIRLPRVWTWLAAERDAA